MKLYNSKSTKAEEFICDKEINSVISISKNLYKNKDEIDKILKKAEQFMK